VKFDPEAQDHADAVGERIMGHNDRLMTPSSDRIKALQAWRGSHTPAQPHYHTLGAYTPPALEPDVYEWKSITEIMGR
jgi:hypothetical protein